MRPLFLNQIIFAGYMSCTSIFYWMRLLGFHYLDYSQPVLDNSHMINMAAQCQRMYCLGHAALATGLLWQMRYPMNTKTHIQIANYSSFFLKTALIAFPVSIIIAAIPGLNQFSLQAKGLSFSAGTLALAFAIPEKRRLNTTIAAVLFFANVLQAMRSGFKEPIIVAFLILGIFLFPFYRKLVLVIMVPVILLLFFVLPTFNTVFRQKAWSEGVDPASAARIALDAVINGTNNSGAPASFEDTNWAFLTLRLSEMSMFIQFKEQVPEHIPYEGLNLIKQAALSTVPRLIWPSKPITEQLVMQRVIRAGIVSETSNVSAKPAYIVDSYLSAGPIGVFLGLFIYGVVSQWLARKAEYLFGSYLLGNALIFTGMFQALWRGNSYEFIVNIIFWSTVGMYLIFYLFKRLDIITVAE